MIGLENIMFVHFPSPYLSQLWEQISQMLFANYSIGYEKDCVLLCPHRISQHIPYFKSIYSNSKIIAYQLEQLGSHLQMKVYMDDMINALSKYDEVWDYDLHNIEILSKYGINAKFKPFQYTEALKTVRNLEDPDIDVLFIGSPAKSRAEFIDSLINKSHIPSNEFEEQLSIKIISAHQYYGKFKDELTARAKIVLSIPVYPDTPCQGQARIFHDLINNKCVLSKKAPYNYYDNLIVEYDNHNDCAEKIRYLLRKDNWKNYTNYSFKEYCDKKYKGL